MKTRYKLAIAAIIFSALSSMDYQDDVDSTKQYCKWLAIDGINYKPEIDCGENEK